MLSPTESASLSLLRHRFLMEDADKVSEWLWEEHPQTAAFLIHWLGDPDILATYLNPLPPLQQADVLYRIASLPREMPITREQEEILIDALRNLAPYLREAGTELTAEDAPPVRGERLMRAYLASLPEDKLHELLARMEDVDIPLARIGAALAESARQEGGDHTYHGLLNVYCDLLSHMFTRLLHTPVVVYTDRVEMIDAESTAGEEPGRSLPFRLPFGDKDSYLFLLIPASVFLHYLEQAFGAGQPNFFQDLVKADCTRIESRIGLELSQLMADNLNLAFALEDEEESYRAEEASIESYLDEMAKFGKTPLLLSQLTVKFGQSVRGQIRLVMPPSHLMDLQTVKGGALFENLFGGSLPGALPDPAGESRQMAPGSPAGPDGGTAPESPGKEAKSGRTPEAEPGSGEEQEAEPGNLEDFLWRIEMEEAEPAEHRSPELKMQPLDRFLQGYAPDDIAAEFSGSPEEKERLAEVHYFYGTRLFQKNFYADAAEALEKAVKESPGHEGGQLLLAAAWGEQGLYFKEIVTYKRLISESLALPEAHILLARRLSFLGRADDAFAELQRAVDRGYEPMAIVEADPCFRALQKSVKWRQYLVDHS